MDQFHISERITIRQQQDYGHAWAFGVICAALLVVTFWKWIVAFLLVVWVGTTVAFLVGLYRQGVRDRAERDAALSQRADEQHRWVFQGNPKGYFGHDWSYDDEGHKP